MNYIFKVSSSGAVHLTIQDEQGQIVREIPEAIRMKDACRRLKRSPRHLYRYVKRGWLKPVAKFSGELFFDLNELFALECRGPESRRRALPPRMAPLFPEYDLKTLEPERDADLVLSRILERGSEGEIQWARRRYSRARHRLFLSRQGPRLLSPRTLHFWAWLWGMAVPKSASWRRSGLAWGGAA